MLTVRKIILISRRSMVLSSWLRSPTNAQHQVIDDPRKLSVAPFRLPIVDRIGTTNDPDDLSNFPSWPALPEPFAGHPSTTFWKGSALVPGCRLASTDVLGASLGRLNEAVEAADAARAWSPGLF